MPISASRESTVLKPQESSALKKLGDHLGRVVESIPAGSFPAKELKSRINTAETLINGMVKHTRYLYGTEKIYRDIAFRTGLRELIVSHRNSLMSEAGKAEAEKKDIITQHYERVTNAIGMLSLTAKRVK